MNRIKYIKGDATNPPKTGQRIIAHIVNDAGLWGAGFVMAVSRRWPEPEQAYRARFRERVTPQLGEIQTIIVDNGLVVANMVAQHGVGIHDGKPPIRYDALKMAMKRLVRFAKRGEAGIHMPRIGCGLAGGSWSEIEPIILEEFCAKDIEVIVYDLP